MITHPAVPLPDHVTERLGNGLSLIVSSLPTVPMIQACLAIPVTLDTADQLAAIDVMSAYWPDTDASRAFEQAGGSVGIDRQRDWLIVSLTARAHLLRLLTATLAAIVHGSYTDAGIDRARARCRHQATLIEATPAARSQQDRWIARYGHLPIVLQAAPAPATLDAVTTTAVTAIHHRQVTPERAHLLVVGDVDEDAVLDAVRADLGQWARGPATDPQQRPAPSGSPGLRTIAYPHWQQTHIRLAADATSGDDLEAFAAATVASLVLGGNFASRLTRQVREDHGLAYQIATRLDTHLGHTVLTLDADVNPAHAGQALQLIAAILTDMARTGPTDRELRAAAGYIAGMHTLVLGAQSSRASCLLSYLISAQPLTAVSDLPQLAAQLSPAQVRVAAESFTPQLVGGVVCGADDTEHRWGR
ncbi:M16 family metallopeptidase [Nocardia sp. NPDC051570]|uniref:M16 family metallopeptidase n=1 Tax=Nocardia sp. NPDC051570 TaxID=3364324 RepID=UPI0037B5D23C